MEFIIAMIVLVVAILLGILHSRVRFLEKRLLETVNLSNHGAKIMDRIADLAIRNSDDLSGLTEAHNVTVDIIDSDLPKLKRAMVALFEERPDLKARAEADPADEYRS